MTREEKRQAKCRKKEAALLRRRFTATFFAHNRLSFFVTLGAVVLICGTDLMVAWLIQQIMDAASGSDTMPLLRMAVWCLFFLVVRMVLELLRRYTLPVFMRRAMQQYKEYAFGEITKKNISSFTTESTGRYISALTNDAASVESNYLEKQITLVLQLVLFFGTLVMMLYYSPLLTGIAVLISLLPIVVSLLCGRQLATKEKQVSNRNESFVSMTEDLLSGFSVIKSFRAEREAIEQFSEQNRELEECKRAKRMTERKIDIIGMGTYFLAQFGVFLAGAYLAVTGGSVTAGTVIMFVQLMNYILNPISTVPSLIASREAASALIDKLAEATGANPSHDGKTVAPVLKDRIEIRDLTFGYEPEQPVLKNVSLQFESGKSYAVVGSSGSGKSTLLNLLMGSFDQYEGSICFDGDELRSVNTDSLYDLISMIQQNVFVFNNTIRQNITMFRDFPQEQVDRAIKMSGLSALIEQRGADYHCGENGAGLSGGERQRISIARSLLRGTPVLLVDEATASLDPATAYAVSSSILDISGLTRVVVTHRLDESLLCRYDRIVVMRGGRVCEQGTFEELMQKRGYFYSLYMVSSSDE